MPSPWSISAVAVAALTLAVCQSCLAQADALPSAEVTRIAQQLTQASDTSYVSDYLSFAGSDLQGHVLFALDTNRGRQSARYQAEHFVTLYAEPDGWVPIEGYDDFENTGRRLLELPESPFFDFTGRPYSGLTVSSKTAPLTLRVEPLTSRVTLQSDATLFSMASGAATLTIGERTVEGRVIYEYLVMSGANRLAGVSLRGLLRTLVSPPSFQGLYLASADGLDFYVHETTTGAASSTAPLLAFMADQGVTVNISDLSFEVTDYDLALGAYRWPSAWRVRWQGEKGAAELVVGAISHDTQKNWFIGGFAMQAVVGALTYDGRTTPVFGFGELIR